MSADDRPLERPRTARRILSWLLGLAVLGLGILTAVVAMTVAQLQEVCALGYMEGALQISPPLTSEQRDYLIAFSETRRMTWDEAALKARPDPLREAVGLPVGPQGAYYVGLDGLAPPIVENPALLDHNDSGGQPTLHCDWRPNEAGDAFVYAGPEGGGGGQDAWPPYLYEHFLEPWGRHVKGTYIDLASHHVGDPVAIRMTFEDDRVDAGLAPLSYQLCGWLGIESVP